MNVAVLTSLFTSSVRPYEGIFAETRWRTLATRGHAVRVVHPQPWAPLAFLGPWLGRPQWREIARMPEQETRGGLPVERPRFRHVPGRARANAEAFARAGMRAVLEGARPDVVVADYAWPAACAAPACRAAGLPLVVSGRGSDVLQVAQEAGLGDDLARHLRTAGRWCAVSQDLVGAMDALADAPGRGVLVPNGVDLERFRPRPRARARAELGLDPDAPLVLVVGHLIERKDPLLALAALAASGVARATCAFVGSGPLEAAVRARARELGLGDRVRLEGALPPERLERWYAAADCLLLCSRREGRPNVVLEALGCGRPVVATRAGGTAELLGDLEGALAATREPEELGRLLARQLADPPAPEALHARIAHLSWEACADALERLLESALGDAA